MHFTRAANYNCSHPLAACFEHPECIPLLITFHPLPSDRCHSFFIKIVNDKNGQNNDFYMAAQARILKIERSDWSLINYHIVFVGGRMLLLLCSTSSYISCETPFFNLRKI